MFKNEKHWQLFDCIINFKEGKMRKTGLNIDEIKSKIIALKGREVEMNINRGRKKIQTVSGVIQDIYPSVFTVAVSAQKSNLQTFSYYDVLCGNVVFCK